jgi:uncharacterized protein
MLPAMRLTQERPDNLNVIRSYGERSLRIGEREFVGPTIVAPREVIAPWPAVAPRLLAISELQLALNLKPRILLLAFAGVATDLSADLRSALRDQQIGLEIMERGAACRTYNVLATEGRDVTAVFW